MAVQKTSPQPLKAITGALLLALGFLVLFANLDTLTSPLTGAYEQTPGVLPVLIMATLHALQTYAFDHAGFLSGVLQILVSFWPLMLVIIGAVLLRDAFWADSRQTSLLPPVRQLGDR
jgi:hypothetical protein